MKTPNKMGVVLFYFLLLNSIAYASEGNITGVAINGFFVDVKNPETGTQKVIGKEKNIIKKWIVQFSGPIYEADKKKILDIGCRIHDYIPEFAFIVSMDEKTKNRVDGFPFIQGVVKYNAEYKIEKKLAEKIRKNETIKQFHIRADSAENLSVILSAVLKKKGVILDVGRAVARVKVDSGAINQIANLEEVAWIEEAADMMLLNDTSKWTIQSYTPENTTIWGKGILGDGQIVGIGDTGVDYDMPWFYDPSGVPIGPTHRKIVGYTSYADDYDGTFGHGTHVSGTVAGNRTPVDGFSDANGMAPDSKIFMQDLTPGDENSVYPPSDLGLLFNTPYYAGARLHTNSWGATANAYDTFARTADLFIWENNDFLAFFANGNSGDAAGTVGTPATAKNVVSVGASENGLNAENLAWFSSNGPTTDGRTKPTVTAPGVNIVSADSDGIKNSFNSGTIAMSGTSMATPTVAGAAALVRQYYTDGYWPNGTANAANGFEPSAAMVKATLINSAQNMTGNYTDALIPSTGQGWGRINLSNVLHFFGDNKFLNVTDVTSGLLTDATWSWRYFSAGTQMLKVTLVWSDYPGAEEAAKALVNDLDLSVTAPDGTTYKGNVFQNGVSIAGGSADRLNVEEQVLIPPTLQPGNYTVSVTGYNVPFGPQPFTVVVTGAADITSKGFIYIDKTRYNGSDTIKINVGDRDLNHNSSVAETVSVIIKSTTEPGGETVQLVESGPDTAMFTGSIVIRRGAAQTNNGYLEVAEGDTITATYLDADNGTGTPSSTFATALADLSPPVISAITINSVGQDSATVMWTTNEPASAAINYGDTKGLGASRSNPWFMTSQSLTIKNLKEATTYYYEVNSTDEAGNIGRDNNGGALYTFTTLSLPPAITVNSSNFTVTYQPETVIYGTASDPSGVAVVAVNGQPASYRPSDGYYELTVPLTIGENFFTVTATDTLGNSNTLSIKVIRNVPPDLVITSLVSPVKGGWNEPIHIENSVCNIGSGTSPGTGYITWVLSADTVISPAEDRMIGALIYGDDILPGECVSIPVDIQLSLPVSFVSTAYYVGGCVDASDDIWESDETNNCRTGNQMTIEGPDLVVSSVSNPATALTATNFTVSNTVTNIGVGASPTVDVLVYLSTDPIITRSDIIIGYRHIPLLEPVGSPSKYPSESRDDTVVTIPSTVPGGTYYIGVIVDPYNTVKESNDANNARTGTPVTVIGPDIEMASVSGPASGSIGQAITVSNTVITSATGGGSSGFNVALYLSTDSMISTSDIYLGSRYVNGLVAGGSSTSEMTLTLPSSASPGTYYIGAIADYDNKVSESNEMNNAIAGNQIKVAASNPPGVVLTPTTVSVTEGGATATYTVALASQPLATVTITATPDSQVTVDKAALTFTTSNWNVAQSVTVTAVNDAVAQGAHTGTITHRASGGGYDAVVISSVTASITDNDIAGVVINPTTVSVTEGGATATYTVALASQPLATVTITATPDSQVTVDKAALTFTTSNWNVAQSVTVTAVNDAVAQGAHTGTITHRASGGGYDAVVISSVTASITDNDIAGVVITPTTVSVTEGGATATYTVALASQPLATVTITATPDSQVTVDKAALTFTTSNWNVAQSVTVTAVNDAVAQGAHTGTITHRASGGGYDAVVISNVTANITDNDTAKPDLVVSGLSSTAQTKNGVTITVKNTVSNIGGASSGGFLIGIYLSSDNIITNSDIYIGSRYVGWLMAGASNTGSTTVTLPSSLGAGTYYIGAIADYNNEVSEQVETNNIFVGNSRLRIK
ncbi:S8 family serine peptidase [Geomonas nitrogeniifigens]|uniref:CARDB domain-containing protein n=1 Tax=Geomonas diazotrophica TaxID=2843197 RepID=UPI001C2C61C2|nr:CARDB domain-containing protein [Geomonas nitrogeniifigens]QXE85498.1 S8 family serine peptidase [Geomonas nitrogeniifigens]